MAKEQRRGAKEVRKQKNPVAKGAKAAGPKYLREGEVLSAGSAKPGGKRKS